MDIKIRFRRKGAQPTYEEDDYREGVMRLVYNENDIQKGPHYCNNSGEFWSLEDFITHERYGEYIDLESTSEDYKKLLQLVEKTAKEHIDIDKGPGYYDPDNYDDFVFSGWDDFQWLIDSADSTIFALYATLIKAPVYEQLGWIIQLKAELE